MFPGSPVPRSREQLTHELKTMGTVTVIMQVCSAVHTHNTSPRGRYISMYMMNVTTKGSNTAGFTKIFSDTAKEAYTEVLTYTSVLRIRIYEWLRVERLHTKDYQ